MTVKIPAQHIVEIAKTIEAIQSRGTVQGLPVEDLHVLVDDGEMTLKDSSGTFGTRRWKTTA